MSKKNAQDGNNRRLYIVKGKISSLNLNSEKITYKWRISTLWDQSSSLIYMFLGSPKKRRVDRKKKHPENIMVLKSIYFYKTYKHTDLNSTKPKHKKQNDYSKA